MNSFLNIAASNAAIAALLALFAFAVTRCWRCPHVAHALWLLVLIKLVTPPVMSLPLPEAGFLAPRGSGAEEIFAATVSDASPGMPTPHAALAAARRESEEAFSPAGTKVAGSTAETNDAASPMRRAKPAAAAKMGRLGKPEASSSAGPPTAPRATYFSLRAPQRWALPNPLPASWPTVAVLVWSAGGLVYVLVLLRQCARFRGVLASAGSASDELLTDAGRFAESMGLVRCPRVQVVDARIPPLVWCLGLRPTVLLPRTLLAGLDRPQRQAVLVHELAHVRRRDHLVRWLEVLVMVLFWWNPIAWWARREIRRAEEECCDAWVVWVLPQSRRSYGQALWRTIEFLTERHMVPAAGGTTFGGFLFKRRIEMILKRETQRRMSWAAWALVVLLAATTLPVAAQTAEEDDPPAANKEKAKKHADLEHSRLLRQLERAEKDLLQVEIEKQYRRALDELAQAKKAKAEAEARAEQIRARQQVEQVYKSDVEAQITKQRRQLFADLDQAEKAKAEAEIRAEQIRTHHQLEKEQRANLEAQITKQRRQVFADLEQAEKAKAEADENVARQPRPWQAQRVESRSIEQTDRAERSRGKAERASAEAKPAEPYETLSLGEEDSASREYNVRRGEFEWRREEQTDRDRAETVPSLGRLESRIERLEKLVDELVHVQRSQAQHRDSALYELRARERKTSAMGGIVAGQHDQDAETNLTQQMQRLTQLIEQLLQTQRQTDADPFGDGSNNLRNLPKRPRN